MIVDQFCEGDTEVIFSYLPVWEMFFSMHVLANPEHHTSRRKWTESKEKSFPELVKEIRRLGELTDSWILIIDSARWSEIRQMEIDEMLSFFRKMNIYQWNGWVKCPAGKVMNIDERDRILEVTKQYYDMVFRKEEGLLRPYLLRILRSEKEQCRQEGIWNWCKRIHNRLLVEETAVIYLKNREYRFEKKEIRTIFATVSSFVDPHLWLYKNDDGLEVVKGVLTEQTKGGIPTDFVRIWKALGNQARLQIIKHLLQGVCTPQALAREMGISEAAVSRHLKIMSEAGLVGKRRKGLYTEYEFRQEVIDYIPYTFYETMMR
ncbi:MAG: metalloregulator ArsR/SmtB family transcription factor [Eubacteriales bacterium]|nr:metalloregulator ArsR/SmtB family transcription factor [Eubacteriales bacterium]